MKTPVMPYAVTAMALIALAALFRTSGLLPTIPVFAVAILASYGIRARMEPGGIFPWVLRAFLVFLVFTLTPESDGSDLALGGSRARNIVGQLWATEMTLRFWWRVADPAKNRLLVLLFSGFLFLSASNTFDDQYIRYLAPLYVISVAATALTYRSRPDATRSMALRLVLLALAISLGFGGYYTIYSNKGRLNELGDRILSQQRNPFEATGMAATPQLGETFGLRGSNARVLRIENFAGDSHWRGMAFETYIYGRWTPAFGDRTYRGINSSELSPPGAASRPAAKTMQVTRLINDPLVFAPLQTIAVAPTEAQNGEWSPENGGPIRINARSPFVYGVTIAENEAFQGLLATPNRPPELKKYLQLPPDFDKRIPELARRITARTKTDREKADAIANYLILNYPYNLTIKVTTRDPLVDFLFAEPKKGAHCEYFAASAALLLRCVGVPARYVTGYYAHEELFPGAVIVRGKDAHAWCEAWVNGVGWRTVEATPGDGRPDGDPTRVEWWRRAWEWAQDRWEAFRAFLSNLPIEASYTLLVLTGIGIAWYLYARSRRRQLLLPDVGYKAPDAQLAALAIRFEREFARRGTPFSETLPYSESLARREDKDAPLIAQGKIFVERYNNLRFGNRDDAAAIDSLKRIIETMESEK